MNSHYWDTLSIVDITRHVMWWSPISGHMWIWHLFPQPTGILLLLCSKLLFCRPLGKWHPIQGQPAFVIIPLWFSPFFCFSPFTCGTLVSHSLSEEAANLLSLLFPRNAKNNLLSSIFVNDSGNYIELCITGLRMDLPVLHLVLQYQHIILIARWTVMYFCHYQL